MSIFFAKFDGAGNLLETRSGGNNQVRQRLTLEGFVPVAMPEWVEPGAWSGIRQLENGGVVFEFPPHVRRWDEFKDALIQDARSQAITAAAFSHPALGTALTLFLAAIDSLDQRATPERLLTFYRMWLAFRGLLDSLVTAQVLEAGIVDAIKAIALVFDIELPDTLPEGEPDEPN